MTRVRNVDGTLGRIERRFDLVATAAWQAERKQFFFAKKNQKTFEM
jgi:hypothetical protein